MTDVTIPSVGESITEVTIATWLKEDGDYVEMDEAICEIESDKATLELPAPVSGVLKIITEEGDTVDIGTKVAVLDETASAPAGAAKPVESQSQTPPPTPSSEVSTSHSDVVSPAAGKILAEKGLSASDVTGTGKDGRITKADAMSAQKKKSEAKKDATTTAPKMTGSRETERKRMSGLRKTIAKRLVQAKNTTAMLTTFNEIDMSACMALRSEYKEAFKEKYETGLGFMSFFTKACVAAMEKYPAVNAQIDGTDIIYHNYADVGIAVSTPKGLVVPVMRNAENLGFADIEKEIRRLALKGRDGKLSIDEMTGGTFTITNGGVFGSMLSTPILNAPQSAILGMHNIVERPVAVDGKVEIRPVMYVALSYDHRIVDGKESVGFLKTIKEMIEDPRRLLLGV